MLPRGGKLKTENIFPETFSMRMKLFSFILLYSLSLHEHFPTNFLIKNYFLLWTDKQAQYDVVRWSWTDWWCGVERRQSRIQNSFPFHFPYFNLLQSLSYYPYSYFVEYVHFNKTWEFIIISSIWSVLSQWGGRGKLGTVDSSCVVLDSDDVNVSLACTCSSPFPMYRNILDRRIMYISNRLPCCSSVHSSVCVFCLFCKLNLCRRL